MTSSDDWVTPGWLVQVIHAYRTIDLDPATSSSNPTRARRFFTEEDDSPCIDWKLKEGEFCYVNPPYSRHKIPLFVDAILENTKASNETLVLCRLDNTRWMSDLLDHASGMIIPFKRVNFELPGTRAEVRGSNFATTLIRIGGTPGADFDVFAEHFEVMHGFGSAMRRR